MSVPVKFGENRATSCMLTARPQCTMVENRKKNSHSIIHCPTSEGVSEVSERANE